MKYLFAVLGMGLLITITGCGGIFNNDVDGEMSCDIDGDKFKANIAVVATYSDNILTVTGSGNVAEQCQVIVHDCTGPGTYQIEASSTERNAGRWTESIDPNTGTYSTNQGLGSGTVEVIALSETEVEGTFSFTAKNMEEAEVTVTDGTFKAKIQD